MPRHKPKKTMQEVVKNSLKTWHLDEFDAVDHAKWRKLIRGREVSGD